MEQQKQQVNIPAILYSAKKLSEQQCNLYEQLIDALVRDLEEKNKLIEEMKSGVKNG